MKTVIKKILKEYIEVEFSDDYIPLKPDHPLYTGLESIIDLLDNPYQVDYAIIDDIDYDVMVKFELNRSKGGLKVSKKEKKITGEITIDLLELYYICLTTNEIDYLRYMSDVSQWHWDDFRDALRDKIIDNLPALENVEIIFNPIFQKK
jgi:hypothetical protein